jgi:hypothetical protein
MSLERPVALIRGCVAAQLPRSSTVPAQPGSDLPDAQPGMAKVGDLDPLVLGQEPAADLTHGQPGPAQARTRSPGRTGRSCSHATSYGPPATPRPPGPRP